MDFRKPLRRRIKTAAINAVLDARGGKGCLAMAMRRMLAAMGMCGDDGPAWTIVQLFCRFLHTLRRGATLVSVAIRPRRLRQMLHRDRSAEYMPAARGGWR